ncbi:hypothetical protein DH26_gp016 [Chloriridovirus anopheles1]|uniref:Phosphodiester glycosidase domain-containing protein n=1 Tax=Chloriridovirus anopheles1 TaxID=1465751 RepID=W8QRB2_9VIRU|nr:hypothetical protein DH26_gp016 [Anopheles minimus iridovirus]AHL67517.1 hypothetical protein AMIV_016 [Anopheles minimus iridovirus]
MSISYKKIDTIPKLLENLWSIFPNIIALDSTTQDPVIGAKLVNDAVIVPAIQNSAEFCQLVKNGTIGVKAFAKGGFGQVGDLTINEDQQNQPLSAIIISIKRYGGFEPFYIPVIMKLYFNQEFPKWYISPISSLKDPSGLHNALFVSDPLSEMVFGSMLGHLYDTGICPFFTKYFGAYVCNETNQTSIITEKAHFELKQLISRNTNTPVVKLRPLAILNLLFQYVYGLYIMKIYYGLVHFDTQHRNIMVSYIHDRIFKFKGAVVSPYIYQGEYISSKKLILFQTHKSKNGVPVYLCIQNTGLLLKIIDYGVCCAHLDRSMIDKYKVNMTISSIHEDLKRINAEKAYENTVKHPLGTNATLAYSNTVDLQYTLNNVYEHVLKGLDTHVYQRSPDPKAPTENAEMLRLLQLFTERFFGTSIEDHLNQHPEQRIQPNPKGKLSWVSYKHDAGLVDSKWSSPLSLLEGLIDVCDKGRESPLNFKKLTAKKAHIVYFEPEVDTILSREVALDDKNTLLLNTSASDYQYNMNQFSQWMETSKLYHSKCQNDMVNVECTNLKAEKLKYSLSSTISKKLFSPTPLATFSPQNLFKSNALFDYYQYQFNPKAINLNRNMSGGLVYQTFQSWLDFNLVPEARAGLYIETIFLHVFKLKTLKSIEVKKGIDLWNGSISSLVGENGLSINGGYFIVKGNLNKLYPNLNESSLLKPIGYSYVAGDRENGTVLPFPDIYDDDLGVVYGTRGDGVKGATLKLESWNKFRNRHSQIDDVVRYEGEDGTVIEQPIKSISMDGGVLVGQNVSSANEEYDFAFVTGPILISGGKVVFTNEKMNNQVMTVNNQLVHAVPGAQNSYKYRAAAGEGNQYYGMRHSHRYMVHNVLALDSKGVYYIFLCEGRGFDAPGLDRVQLSYLIQKFGIDSAIALDGGFSANAVYKDCSGGMCKPVFTLNDPEKRKLGISVYFS